MNDIQNNFQKQNDELLEFILFNKFISEFNKDGKSNNTLELYVTTECNQKCEYCYLVKNGDRLYPKEIRGHDLIKKNLKIILDFLFNNNLYIHELDIFSGEILGTELGNFVLNTILQYVNRGLNIGQIVIPSNCSFIMNKEKVNIMQSFFDKFKDTNTRLHISASIDGGIIEADARSFNDVSLNLKKDKEFYKNFFQFVKKNNLGIHPMISAFSIEKWKDNLDWWEDHLKSIGRDVRDLMTLEVRNNDWTFDKIISLLDFLNYCCDKYMVEYGIEEYINDVFLHKSKKRLAYKIEKLSIQNKKSPTCAISKSLTIRLGDLSIVPCHRLSYDKLIYGKFIVENDTITGISSNNVQLANKILLGSCKSSLKCDTCSFNNFCVRGCLGCQYEENEDPLIPCDSVCDMEIAKTCFLIEKYYQIGIIDLLKKQCDKNIVSLLDNINKIIETKEFKEWQPIIRQIINQN